jgi:hypothetical protein
MEERFTLYALYGKLKYYFRPLVPKVCYANPKVSATSSKDIRGYSSVMAALTFTYFVIKGIMFC